MNMKPKKMVVDQAITHVGSGNGEKFARVDFDACLSNGQMESMEQGAQHPDHGCARRIALAVLTRSKRQLSDSINAENIIALMHSYDAIHAYHEHIKAVCGTVEAAENRLLYVLEEAIHDHPDWAHIEMEDG